MEYLYNCSNNYQSGQITITVQNHRVTFTIFLQKLSFQKFYGSGPRILKKLTHENGTLRNNTANIIIQWLHV